MRSWKSAQGFRLDGRKPRVIDTGARIFHYGWVRPPETMKRKQMALDRLHHPEEWVKRRHPQPEVGIRLRPARSPAAFHADAPRRHAGVDREQERGTRPTTAGRARCTSTTGDRCAHSPGSRINLLQHRLGEYRNYVRID